MLWEYYGSMTNKVEKKINEFSHVGRRVQLPKKTLLPSSRQFIKMNLLCSNTIEWLFVVYFCVLYKMEINGRLYFCFFLWLLKYENTKCSMEIAEDKTVYLEKLYNSVVNCRHNFLSFCGSSARSRMYLFKYIPCVCLLNDRSTKINAISSDFYFG